MSLAIALTAAAAAAVVLLVERRAARLRLLDRPNERSSHVVPRPRGGGLGILAGVAVGLMALAATGLEVSPELATVLAAALLVALTGLWDDLVQLSPSVRLAAQTTGAAIVVAGCGHLGVLPLPGGAMIELSAVPGSILAAVWIVAVTNFFNFMDGADGLAGGQALLTFGALALVAWPDAEAAVALLIVVATAVFLTRNWSPARIFLGDVGSGGLGFLLAALPFAVADGSTRGAVVVLVATSLALFLVDPLITLVRRFVRGARITESHREHVYQRLIAAGKPHAPVVAGMLLAAASLTLVGIWAYNRPDRMWLSLAWAAVVCVAEWVIAALRDRVVSR